MKTSSGKKAEVSAKSGKQFTLSLVIASIITITLAALSQVCGNFPVEALLSNQPAHHSSHRVGCVIARLLGVEYGDVGTKLFPSEHGGPNGLQVTVRVHKGLTAAETIGGVIDRLTSTAFVLPDMPGMSLEFKRASTVVETFNDALNTASASGFEEFVFAFSINISPKVAEVGGTSAAAIAAQDTESA